VEVNRLSKTDRAVTQDPLQPNKCAELLAALAAAERLRIVRFLRDGPRNVTEIAEMLQVPAVNVSHHLAVLRHAGLIQSEKLGRFMLYSLVPGVLLPEGDPACDQLDLGCCQLKLPRPE
jgi:DNA-binding transcriptional ArsR family regulator